MLSKREWRRSELLRGLRLPLSSTRPTMLLSLKEPTKELWPEGPDVELETTPSKDLSSALAVQAPVETRRTF